MREPQLTTVPRDLYYHEVAYVRRLEAALKNIAEDDPSGKWGRWAREALAPQGCACTPYE